MYFDLWWKLCTSGKYRKIRIYKRIFQIYYGKRYLSLERFSHKYLKDRQVAIDVLDRIEYHVLSI